MYYRLQWSINSEKCTLPELRHSLYSEMVEFSRQTVRDLTAYLFDHAGDGNIHVNVMEDLKDQKHWAAVEEASERIVMRLWNSKAHAQASMASAKADSCRLNMAIVSPS